VERARALLQEAAAGALTLLLIRIYLVIVISITRVHVTCSRLARCCKRRLPVCSRTLIINTAIITIAIITITIIIGVGQARALLQEAATGALCNTQIYSGYPSLEHRKWPVVPTPVLDAN